MNIQNTAFVSTPQYKAIFTLLLECKHQRTGHSSNEQEPDCCSQAPHDVNSSQDSLYIRALRFSKTQLMKCTPLNEILKY